MQLKNLQKFTGFLLKNVTKKAYLLFTKNEILIKTPGAAREFVLDICIEVSIDLRYYAAFKVRNCEFLFYKVHFCENYHLH